MRSIAKANYPLWRELQYENVDPEPSQEVAHVSRIFDVVLQDLGYKSFYHCHGAKVTIFRDFIEMSRLNRDFLIFPYCSMTYTSS